MTAERVNKELIYDMASVQKHLPEFHGEDTAQWLRDTSFIAATASLTDHETLQAMNLALRGKALSWASRTFGTEKSTTLEIFKEQLTLRFNNQNATNDLVERIMNATIPTNKTDYLRLLRDANTVLDRGAMNVGATMRLVVSKFPLS